MAYEKSDPRQRRKKTIRKRIHGTPERPRLTVFRSNQHIYAQAVDDVSGTTIAAVSTKTKSLAGELAEAGTKTDASKVVGRAIAKALQDKGVKTVVFDRNGYLYRPSNPENPESRANRIGALAEAAREAGLDF